MKRVGWIVVGVCFLSLFLIVFSQVYSEKQTKNSKQISVILYGNNIDRWQSLKQGMEQAGKDYGGEVNYVLMSLEHDKEEQLSLIQREIDNHADAVIIAANDSSMDLSSIRLPSKKYPILCVESGVDNQDIALVSADNYKMGESLAKEVIDHENEIAKIAIIMNHQQRDSVKARYEGFYNKIVEKFDNFTFWRSEKGENRAIIFAQRELTQEAVDVVIALDNSSLEAVIDATLNLNKNVKIYGIANSDKAVYYLDNGKVKTLVYQDEFSIGYISVKSILDGTTYKKEKMSHYIKYHVVDDTTLYLPENQHVLFPFVK